MFKAKIKSISKNSFFILALLLFVASQSVSMLHSFSHNDFLGNKIEFAKDQPSQKHHSEHCSLCFSANFQNQIFASTSLIFVAAIFYLTFSSRVFDRVKASYFRTSNSSRAPPFNS